jgi:hypothetical protein
MELALGFSRKSVSLAHLGKKVPGVLCKRRGISASPGSFSEHYRTPKLRVDDAHVPIRLRSCPSCPISGLYGPANFACGQFSELRTEGILRSSQTGSPCGPREDSPYGGCTVCSERRMLHPHPPNRGSIAFFFGLTKTRREGHDKRWQSRTNSGLE